MPGAMEASPGGAPEIMVHKESADRDSDEELSPEEQAVQGVNGDNDQRKPLEDENADAAALAEGRTPPPRQ